MSLFKKPILNCYNLIKYQDDFLLLHCSRNDMIHAPFDGEIKKIENGCILYNDNFKLYITHINCDTNQKVIAGESIGTPMIGRILGERKAYIGIKIYYKNKICDILTYLTCKDKDIQSNKKIENKSNKKNKK